MSQPTTMPRVSRRFDWHPTRQPFYQIRMRRVLASVLIVTALLLSAAAPTLALFNDECGCSDGPCDQAAMPCADVVQCASGQCLRLVAALLPTGSEIFTPAATWPDADAAPGLADRATGPHLRPPNG